MPDETYFQGTEIPDFSYGAGTTHSSTTAYFDSSHVRQAIDIQSSGSSADNSWIETPGTLAMTEFWARFSMRVVPATSSVRYNFVKFYNQAGTEFLSLLLPATGGTTAYDRIAVYRSSTTLLGTSSTGLTLSASVYKIVMYVKLGNPGIVRIYSDTTLIYEDTALDLSGASSISKIRFSNVGGSATSWRLSEVIAANYDLRGSYLALAAPDANGADQQWLVNDYTILDDLAPTSAIYSDDDVGDKTSYSFGNFPAPGGSTVIESLKVISVVSSDAQKVPTPYLKIGGVDYAADPEDVVEFNWHATQTALAHNEYHVWSKNPATNLRFTQAVLNGAEYGLISVKQPLAFQSYPFPAQLQNGTPYSFDTNAYGGTPAYVYSLVGTWPTGLSIDSSTGVISGTPTVNGTYSSLNVKATDADGDEVLIGADFSMTVATTRDWVPSDLASLWAWWKFDEMSEGNGVTVASVTDASGNSRTLTTVGSPVAKTNAQNSLKSLDLGTIASNKRGTFAATNGLTAGTIMGVVKGAASTSDQAGGLCDCGSDTSVNHYTYINGVYSDFLTNTRKSVGNYTVNSWHIACMWSASNDWGYRKNGDTTTQYTTATNTVAGRATTSYLFGDSSSLWSMGGEGGEVVLCSAKLGTTDMEKLEGYLAHKWWGAGVLNPLPSGHTYKNAVPQYP